MLHSVVEYNLLNVTNLLVFSEEMFILNDIWIICSMNNTKCVRQSFTAGRPEFAARFSCHTWMFWCKEIVIGQVFLPHANVFVTKKLLSRMFVSHVLFQWNCVQKKNQYLKEGTRKTNRIPLEWSPVRKNAVQTFSGRSVHAPRSFSLANRHVTQIR